MVKKGLKALGLSAGHIKLTTPANTSVPVPTIILNDDSSTIDHEDSDDEDEFVIHQADFGIRHKKFEDEEKEDDPTYEDLPTNGCVVVRGALKVCLFHFQSSV